MVAIARGLMACPPRTILDGPSAALLQSTEVKRIFLGSSRGPRLWDPLRVRML
jgi:hypothetical protein